MYRVICTMWVLLCAGLVLDAAPATGKVIKVLPHFLDLEGRHALTPSLYDRDAYQAQLRTHPAERSGVRFDIQWRSAAKDLLLRVEVRGTKDGKSQNKVLESVLPKPTSWGRWSALSLSGEEYKQFGEISAWRVTLWSGTQMLDEQLSFLWQGEAERKAVKKAAQKPAAAKSAK
jgi:hypothetical protein